MPDDHLPWVNTDFLITTFHNVLGSKYDIVLFSFMVTALKNLYKNLSFEAHSIELQDKTRNIKKYDANKGVGIFTSCSCVNVLRHSCMDLTKKCILDKVCYKFLKSVNKAGLTFFKHLN